MTDSKPLTRAEHFCARFGLRIPVLLAPMAGVPSVALSAAVANAGGLAACGVLLMHPEEIQRWVEQFRTLSAGAFQLNLWIPDPAPRRDPLHEERIREFLSTWETAETAPGTNPGTTRPAFERQCSAMLEAAPTAISSVMGLYPPSFVAELKRRGIPWFANVSTVTEAIAAEEAGADVIVAQGAEAGGHRASFDAVSAEREMAGLIGLVPAIVDAVSVPVVATGGIADARGVAAALLLGASAAQVGTGFLRCPESGIPVAWRDALSHTLPHHTVVSRVFSGRAGRSIANAYVRAAMAAGAPEPAPYPLQRQLTARMRRGAAETGDIERMQAWAGQSAALASGEPAEAYTHALWAGAQALLA